MAVSWNGKRVLIVEDEIILAILLADHLRELGAEIVGPIADVTRALQVASHGNISGAILDVNLGAAEVWPVARMLAARCIPFIFTTGFSLVTASCETKLQAAMFGHVPKLSKPYRETDAADALSALFPSQRDEAERMPEPFSAVSVRPAAAAPAE